MSNVHNLPDLAVLVKDAVDSAILALPADPLKPSGYECTVDARLEATMPWGVTVTVRWPENVEMLSRDKLAAERRQTMLGRPVASDCWLPLSGEALDLLEHLQEAATRACRRYAGVQSLACEVVLDERQLKEERKKILWSMKPTKVLTDSLYGKFGPVPRKQP